ELSDSVVQSIATLAASSRDANGAIAFKAIPGDPDERQLIVSADGTYQEFPSATKPRNTTLRSVDQVGVYVRHSIDKWGADPVVYYNPTHVIAVLDESGLRPSRNGRVTVALNESPQLKRLRRYDENRNDAWVSHKAFVQMLRIDLADCITPDALEYLLKALSTLDFMDASRTTSNVSRNRESLGSEVKAEIRANGDMEIPEQVTLEVRMFTDPALMARRVIVCKLETDPSNGRLALIPIADEINNAMDTEMAALGDMLRANVNSRPKALTNKATETNATEPAESPAYVPVFYGTP
ncbi:hypothetical protein, partial [Schlesneria sp.]|uniref:hypothetical protein n=1 Tax=Schlesneria sp. TaxID=2762018 RepID=UPI002EE456D1